MDKNQTIGLVLITLMLFGYIFLMDYGNPTEPTPNQSITDSTNQQTTSKISEADTNSSKFEKPIIAPIQPQVSDSALLSQHGIFGLGMKGEEQEITLENQDFVVKLTSYGGKVKEILLKNYVTFEKKPLILFDAKSSKTSLEIESDKGKFDLHDLYFVVAESTDNSVTFRIQKSDGEYIEQKYSIEKSGFTVNYTTELKGINLKVETAKFGWLDQLKRLEKSKEQSINSATVNYFTSEGDFDYLSETSYEPEGIVLAEKLRWIAMKQKFFNAGMITENTFSNVRVATIQNPDPLTVKDLYTTYEIPLQDLANSKIRFYFGPNDYDITETVTEGYQKNVYLGWAMFSTVNKYLIIPIFKLLEKVSSNYGIVILVLVLIIKIVLFPLTYKSYKSMAKTKVLKPELDKIREKHGGDMQKAQPEQMELYQKAGVNPLSGCIPMVAQMPILLAMFNFFPNAIQLRQKGFLWADDLSSYDSILDLPFEIPFYGAHISLFTLLMVASTLAYTWYNSQMTAQTMEGPMKSMQYVFPFMMLFFLNSFASGLTYYYFISNLITIGQQVLIRKFIDEDKIKAVIEKNKQKNTGKKSIIDRLTATKKDLDEKANEKRANRKNRRYK